ncbi:N-acetyltransferase [Pseudomonas sp. FW306-02-F02-AA]|uniref:GCN5 family acetyltransferase n=1 Tax=Pseudomonas fluorescens TaxID=294 RepID=A0A0N9W863_PSEFL|nr:MULTISPECIES: GNAT family N-acetyltransferase [Pseudomonas]ALI03141.1 GCN5 family acetyltransferase [Pseudomonas fluorescens]PMZ01007.1 N-acetyltransferase [Pseudomonas sp. FW306-02-F02-AB]PMZ06837.1 N-acetyltransferase [Pseudomonas sp. FW306-02-H06C]PMZ12804.1 N-acetyltransferase [Pseudomonas sp. FW306-02-F02-AA]PMZ18694.1 N-acetyltransferase [Pseudomonas sp. FW306-02-F08-AA]
MDSPLHICKAGPADAGIISRIVERSIKVGCAGDHRNDPKVVAAWTHNKTVEHVQPWLTDPRLYLNLALLDDKPIGVAMAAVSGKVGFCYVLPEWFRRGAGQALIQGLEIWLIEHGFSQARLNSTGTSEEFFQHLGYRRCAEAFSVAGLTAVPMNKLLTALP